MCFVINIIANCGAGFILLYYRTSRSRYYQLLGSTVSFARFWTIIPHYGCIIVYAELRQV